MGLLDIFKKRRNATQVVPDVTIEYIEDDDCEEPPLVLSHVKPESASVAEPCGFDMSAVRRSVGFGWWLEGANYEKAVEDLRSLKKVEDDARAVCADFPRAVDFLLANVVPYSVGADGNLVPTIEYSSTKSKGSVMTARFNVCRSTGTPMCKAAVVYHPDGTVRDFKLSYWARQGAIRYSLSYEYRKRPNKSELKSVERDELEMLDQKKAEKQLKAREEEDKRLSALMEPGAIEKSVLRCLDVAASLGVRTDTAVRLVNETRGFKRDLERRRHEVRFVIAPKKADRDSGLLIFETSGESSRLRYWERKGAPLVEMSMSGDKPYFVKSNGKTVFH